MVKFNVGEEINPELLGEELSAELGGAFLGISGNGPYCVHLDGGVSEIVVGLAKEVVRGHSLRKRTRAQRARDKRREVVDKARQRVGLVPEDMTFDEFAALDAEKRSEVLYYVWQKVENLDT